MTGSENSITISNKVMNKGEKEVETARVRAEYLAGIRRDEGRGGYHVTPEGDICPTKAIEHIQLKCVINKDGAKFSEILKTL